MPQKGSFLRPGNSQKFPLRQKTRSTAGSGGFLTPENPQGFPLPKGRPPQSAIRQNIVELLLYLQQGYGYQISKLYNQIFPKATRRVIYYHLKKGCDLNEFKVHQIKSEAGNYSWGPTAQKIYYSLDKKAQPQGLKHVKAYLEKVTTSK